MRAEPKTVTARRHLGQQPETFDELALNAQHPPGIGMHPVGRAAGVEQPLVGGGRLHLGSAQEHRTAAALGAGVFGIE